MGPLQGEVNTPRILFCTNRMISPPREMHSGPEKPRGFGTRKTPALAGEIFKSIRFQGIKFQSNSSHHLNGCFKMVHHGVKIINRNQLSFIRKFVYRGFTLTQVFIHRLMSYTQFLFNLVNRDILIQYR